jgi:hypothetical protein
MRSVRRITAAVVIAGALIPINDVIAQAEAGCEGKNLVLFSSDGNTRLTVTRDGAPLFTMDLAPGLLLRACYDRLGARGELAGDVVVRAVPGARPSAGATGVVTMGGSPVVLTLTNVEVMH